MWLGRLDLSDRRVGGRVLAAAAAVALGAEGVSRVLTALLTAHPAEGLDTETVDAPFGTGSMPALPLFLLSVGGAATAVIAVCVRAVARWPGRGWAPLAATGRTALTWYAAHILLGLGTLVALGLVGTEPLPVAAGYGVLFFGIAVLVSWAWMSVARPADGHLASAPPAPTTQPHKGECHTPSAAGPGSGLGRGPGRGSEPPA